MCQSVNPVDIVANVATGGLYGAGKAAVDVASDNTDVLSGIREGLNNLGPWGAATYPVSPELAEKGNLIGAGAGIGGGGMNTFNPAGFGNPAALSQAVAAQAPYYTGAVTYGPEGLPILTGPGGFSAQHVVIDPMTGLPGPGAGILPSAVEGGALGAAGGSSFGSFAGATAGQQLAALLGGASPLSMPAMGAQPAGTAGGSPAATPVNPALIGGSEPHKGLAPDFERRAKGARERQGISTLPMISEYFRG